MSLNFRELERYDRQIRIDGFGKDGQKKLKSAKVVVAGVGGLGCLASIYLAVAGVGELILVDKEKIELNNLNRQVLYWDEDIGRAKVEVATEKLRRLNPSINVYGKMVEITEDNVFELIKGVNVVVDGMDNYKTRFIINKACVKEGVAFVHGAVQGLIGQTMTIVPKQGPCLQCFFQHELPSPRPFPVLGSTPAVIASIEAMEVVKLIVGLGRPNIGRLILFNGEDMSFDEVLIPKRVDCEVCNSQTF